MLVYLSDCKVFITCCVKYGNSPPLRPLSENRGYDRSWHVSAVLCNDRFGLLQAPSPRQLSIRRSVQRAVGRRLTALQQNPDLGGAAPAAHLPARRGQPLAFCAELTGQRRFWDSGSGLDKPDKLGFLLSTWRLQRIH